MLIFLSLLFLSFPLTPLSLNQEGLYLQRVKLGLSDPTHLLSSWNDRDSTPCNWYGIHCDPSTQRVISVDLSESQLSGPFPSFLCRLPYLTSISLYNNTINSSLPTQISNCQKLESLDLGQNLLVGIIPESLSQLQNLRYLNLAGNSLTGEIPIEFGEFKNLETLVLAGNYLNGTIPSQLSNISTLQHLLLAYNPFQPSQISSQLANLTNLKELWLADCKLVGPIPAALSRLTQLENLDLSQNRLTGSIPSSFAEFKSIVQIELYNNSLSGSLPAGFSNLTTLRRFDASMNELSGMIPVELCKLELESLNLFENRLEGKLPESIAKSPNLYELKLFNNKLIGQLPSQLGLNAPLKSLDVSYNGFSGEIPENLCAKGELEDLILIYNSFSGKIPESLGRCYSLGRARLRNNQLSGSVPEEFWGLPRVYLVELVGNSLSGYVSKIISSAHNLSVLLISNNRFSGNIPKEIGFLGNLIEFSASNNMFTGSVPGTFVNLSMLNRLVLNNNKLSGGFPQSIRGWKSLNELNLANNKLSGVIPDEIGDLPVLNYLDLSGNHFSGRIPLELQKLKLNLLNLSNNMLSGDLPPLFAKEIYKNSFVGNPGLCGDLEGLCPQLRQSKQLSYLWILRSIFIIASLIFVVGVAWFYFKLRSFKKSKKVITISKWRSFHKLGFSEFEIANCLKEGNLIGSGASGKVYKVVLSNGETVAVKKLCGGSKKDDASGNSDKDEFEVEVETLGRIRHKNIVRLWCCCNTGDCKLLVYEYMPNGSLGDLLHSSKSGLLDWPTRYKIALDAAEGLSYLHHDCVPPIVHRDVKSNNILLDGEFGARVADFGVAKVVQGVNKGTESMSVIAGSCGYIAPEYAYTLRVNEKSDIYSFGVVILELVTGRLPIDPEFGEKDLVKWVYTTLDQKGVDQVIDSKLDSIFKTEICRVLDVGLRCTSSLPIGRPSMRRVVNMLQEVGAEIKPKSSKKEGKLSPYYHEEATEEV
ncbi:receptor-like protein kinase HSL1 [Ricinus communis]|uniref:non-specific serine/threonine protein kinase n=1 Tax=Ricinus communis TaxID=3988 RepID=B9RVT1_RICCO|nr:receptor-like protein kinase HSL1 [Ricinus communis]EEF44368.1 Receptor protein kinase CLAVATA1 precursor, putative [Ricinus communis]|eukprot:XP_002517850.1 receptor-like protein kinase HSL1 [Ricinus communis]